VSKTERITLRLSPEELANLEQAAALSGMSKSNYLRMLIRGYLPRQTPPEPFQEAIKELRDISGSMAQIVYTTQAQGAVDARGVFHRSTAPVRYDLEPGTGGHAPGKNLMATTAIWKVKGNLGRVVGYAANPDKTENPAFTA
jgi:hypothetical protein